MKESKQTICTTWCGIRSTCSGLRSNARRSCARAHGLTLYFVSTPEHVVSYKTFFQNKSAREKEERWKECIVIAYQQLLRLHETVRSNDHYELRQKMPMHEMTIKKAKHGERLKCPEDEFSALMKVTHVSGFHWHCSECRSHFFALLFSFETKITRRYNFFFRKFRTYTFLNAVGRFSHRSTLVDHIHVCAVNLGFCFDAALYLYLYGGSLSSLTRHTILITAFRSNE